MTTIDQFGFVRVAAAVPAIQLANPSHNAKQVISLLEQAEKQHVDVIVFPEMCLTGYTCNDLFHQRKLLDASHKALKQILSFSQDGFAGLATVGLPVVVDDQLVNAAAVLSRGRLLGIVPKTYLPNYKEFYDARFFAPASTAHSDAIEFEGHEVPFGTNFLFDCPERELVVGVEICEDLWCPIPPSSIQAVHGANLLLNLSASNETIAKAGYRRKLVENQSARCLAGYAYASSGAGESSTDIVFGGHCLIAENGTLLAESKRFERTGSLTAVDIDIQRLRFERIQTTSFGDAILEPLPQPGPRIRFELGRPEKPKTLLRTIDASPFVPKKEAELRERCEEIFHIQTAGVGKRLEQVNTPGIAIGVSGGLDSTLALLVLCKTLDRLEWKRDRVRAITMPGFGTTARTKNNAIELMQALGVSFKEIDIRPLSFLEMKSLGHSPFGIPLEGLSIEQLTENLRDLPPEKRYDLTFENIQARVRTNLLMNTGFTLGTGDLSELALGWCTYNADHMSMYNPNVSIPKTLVKFLVKWAAENEFEGIVRHILLDIVATEISPELLPADRDGKVQSTEGTVGPYELHDFFLFHFLRYGTPPAKILFLASQATFSKPYPPEEIKKWLGMFLRRFFGNQFKRSALPDGPKVGSVSLSPRGDWRMPSDAVAAEWLNDLN